MKADEPKEGKKVALVAILGVTPAVLTEAVWALAQQNCPVVPDDILILTTGTGKKNLDEQIQIDKRKGVWASLKHDLAAEGVSVEGRLNVRVELFLGEDNRPTEDLPTEAANLRAADKMMKELRDYTDDDDWIVYGLLAGGRKTMSALFFSCMCLLGRRDDRIYHVLVSEGYENHLEPPFCYPQRGVVHCGKIRSPKPNRKDPSGLVDVRLKSEDCKVNLFAVPFVFMGEWCQTKCRGKRLSYSNLISAVMKSMNEALMPEIRIDLSDSASLWLDGKKVKISESELLMLMLLAQGLGEERTKLVLKDIQEYLEDVGEEYLDEIRYPWLNKFAESKIFYRSNIKDEMRRMSTVRDDYIKRKSSLKNKLPSVLFMRLFENEANPVPIEWVNRELIHKEILNRIFPDGIQ